MRLKNLSCAPWQRDKLRTAGRHVLLSLCARRDLRKHLKWEQPRDLGGKKKSVFLSWNRLYIINRRKSRISNSSGTSEFYINTNPFMLNRFTVKWIHEIGKTHGEIRSMYISVFLFITLLSTPSGYFMYLTTWGNGVQRISPPVWEDAQQILARSPEWTTVTVTMVTIYGGATGS